MKTFVITSCIKGTPAYIIESVLIRNSSLIKGVIVNTNKQKLSLKKRLQKIINKIFKIGLLGAINGIRMRSWFGAETEALLEADNLTVICKKYNIPLYYTQSLNSNTTKNIINENKVDLGVSLGNSYISSKIFNAFTIGMINIHGEILPDYQNAQSVIWQLYNDSKITGYTIHKINKKIDQGDILYREEVPINFQPTLRKTIAQTCADITIGAANGLIIVLNDFNYYWNNAVKQESSNQYTTPNIYQYIKIVNNFKLLKEIEK